MSNLDRLLATDDTFREVADLLFGSGADQLVSKMNPTQSDVAARKDRRKRAFTAGLSGVGATAGAAGLGLAVKETHHAVKHAPTPLSRKGKLIHAAKSKKLATALIPLEVAGLGGEVLATKILHGDTKKHGVKKDLGDITNNASVPRTKGQLTRAVIANPAVQAKGVEYTKKGVGVLKKLPDKVQTSNTNVEKIWSGEFAKVDSDKQQVFGWASVVEQGGQPVVDLQGDLISVDEMEKAGYSYVMKSRKGGDMHLRDNWSPVQKSEMIESFIVTPEKREAMGLPDSVPSGWWVGFQVQDPEVWAMIKDGRRTGFSIHGHGKRTDA